MKKLTHVALLLISLSMLTQNVSASSLDRQGSGISVDFGAGVNINSSLSDTFYTPTYLFYPSWPLYIPSESAIGGNVMARLGYKIMFDRGTYSDMTFPEKNSPSSDFRYYIIPYVKYQLVSDLRYASQVVFTRNPALQYSVNKISSSYIQEGIVGGGYGFYFPGEQTYMEFDLGLGGFWSSGSDHDYSGYATEFNIKLGYDISRNMSIFVQYNPTYIWNSQDTFSNVGQPVNDPHQTTLSHINPDAFVINALDVGVSFTF